MITPLPTARGRAAGIVDVPGSKSETNRALVLAALGDAPSVLTGVLAARDTELMCDALRALGVQIERDGTRAVVTPPAHFSGGGEIDCGLAGTVMRFVPPLAALADGPTTFHGDAYASNRPMRGLLEGLRQLGARVSSDQLPFTVEPISEAQPGVIRIDASASSQFISGLLLIGARLPHGLKLVHTGEHLPSLPHIEMTEQMLRHRGVDVTRDGARWVVAPGPIRALDSQIEPDLTNASVFLAAAMVAGGRVEIPGWPADSVQPGQQFLGIARRMGASVERTARGVAVSSDGVLRGIDVDLAEASELTPVVAALGALASGTTRIRGVAHIRGHETDRLRALATEFSLLGVPAQETPDGLIITGTAQLTPAKAMETYADHRMVHAAALLSLRTPLAVTDAACVSKTMPDFLAMWEGVTRGRT